MGSHGRKDDLRCSKCYKKHHTNSRIFETQKHLWGVWKNVEVIRKTKGDYFVCRCNNCGHEYRTGSNAAARAYRPQQLESE